jgi:hypothetical protein
MQGGNSSTGSKQLEAAPAAPPPPPPSGGRRFGKWMSRSKTKNSATAESTSSSSSSSAEDVAKDLKNRSKATTTGGQMRLGSTEVKMMEEMMEEAETESPTDDSTSTMNERQAAKKLASSQSSSSSSSSSKRAAAAEKANLTTAAASSLVSAIICTSPPAATSKATKMLPIIANTSQQTPKTASLDLLALPDWEHPSPAPSSMPSKSSSSSSSFVRIPKSVSRPKSSSRDKTTKKTARAALGKGGENQLEVDLTDHSGALSCSAHAAAADDDDDASYVSTGTTQSKNNSSRVASLRSLGSCGSRSSALSASQHSSRGGNHRRDQADDMSQSSYHSRGDGGGGPRCLDNNNSFGSQHSQKSLGSGCLPMFELDCDGTDSEGDTSMDEFFSGRGAVVQQGLPKNNKVYSEITLQMATLSASASILLAPGGDDDDDDLLEYDPNDDPTTMSPKSSREKRNKVLRRGGGGGGKDITSRPDKSPTKKEERSTTPRRSFKAPPTLDSSADSLDSSSISEQCQRKQGAGEGPAVIHHSLPRRSNHRLPNNSQQYPLDCSTSFSSMDLLSVDSMDDDPRTSGDGYSPDDGPVDIASMTDEQLAELEEKMLKSAMERSLTKEIQLDVSAAADPIPLTGGKRHGNRRAPPSLTSSTARPNCSSSMLSSFSFHSSCASLDLRDIAGGGDDAQYGLDDDEDNEIVNNLANMSPEDLAKLEEKMLKMAMQQSLNGSKNIDTSGAGGVGSTCATPIQMSTAEAYERKMASFSQQSRSTRMPTPASPATRRLPLTTPLSAASPSRISLEIQSPRFRAELMSPRQHMMSSSSPARYTSSTSVQQSPRHSSRSTTPGTMPSYPDRHSNGGSYHSRSSERSSSASRMAVPPTPLYGNDRVNNASAMSSSGSSVCSYASIDSSTTDPNTAARLAQIEQEDVLVEMAIQESLREAENVSARSQRSSVPYDSFDSFSMSSRSAVPGQERSGTSAAPPRNITCNSNTTQYHGPTRSMLRNSTGDALSDDESEDDELELADAPMPTTQQSYHAVAAQSSSGPCRQTQSADCCVDISRMQARSRRPARLDTYVKRRPTDKAMI